MTENKGDLISREALKKALDEQMNFDENCRDSVFNIIDNAPTVEPEKVLFANVTFDEDKLKEIVKTEIDKIKIRCNGDSVIKSEERPQGDLISRDYLKCLTYTIEDKYCGEKQVVDLFDINNANPVIPKGEWVKNKTRPNECQCDNCGNYDLSYFPFCHWCGADMRGKEE